MKLFLCGGGSGKQIIYALNRFSKTLNKEKPILYIPLAMDEKKYDSCYEWFEKEIQYMNINKFEMVRSSLELSKKDFENYSALFIGGGNTYKLLMNIKNNTNYEKILNYLKSGGTVFGGSAGAIIFGKDINGCLLNDKNIVNLDDTKGFNMINDYSILCHLNNKNLRKNVKYLKKFTNKNKLIYLPEDNVIYIDDNKFGLIGNKKYIIFKNGNYVFHTNANFKKDFFNSEN
ncbi:MAG: Type 1 glutamine amidotransferase-like domain-containing protein [Bacilli bacterium]